MMASYSTFELALKNNTKSVKYEEKAQGYIRQMDIIAGRNVLAESKAEKVIFFPYYDKVRIFFLVNKGNYQN